MSRPPVPEQERLVASQRELDELYEDLRSAGRIALDTEFMREKTYRAQLCLVQVANADAVWLVDPLKVDLEPLAQLVSEPGVETVVHAGKQDFEILNERYGVVPARPFDVQLAAAFAGYGASLPYGRLVETVLGVQLEKGEAYTDWCRRPLTQSQLHYAADDVRYLLALADRLAEELSAKGRLAWFRQEMELAADPSAYGTAPENAWLRVSGRGSLSARQTAVLKELAAWREQAAARRDLPRGWVLKDPTLIELARRAPADEAGLAQVRGLSPAEIKRSGKDILAAIRRGRAAPPVSAAPVPPRSAQVKARMVSGLADALVRSRCESAGLATELVATRGELEALLAEVFSGRLDESRHRLLQGWRRDLAGEAVVALARGEIALRAVARPPYVEEVPL